MFGLPSTTSLGYTGGRGTGNKLFGIAKNLSGQVSGRADGVDGRLTGTWGTVSLLVGIFGMRERVAT